MIRFSQSISRPTLVGIGELEYQEVRNYLQRTYSYRPLLLIFSSVLIEARARDVRVFFDSGGATSLSSANMSMGRMPRSLFQWSNPEDFQFDFDTPEISVQ